MYFELEKEAVELAVQIRTQLKEVYTQVSHYLIHFAELKFVDEITAEDAAVKITRLRNARVNLGFPIQTVHGRGAGYSGEMMRFRYDPNDKDYVGWSSKQPVPKIKATANRAEVPIGDFIPEEYFGLADDLSRTHQAVLPIPPKICASLKAFLETYQRLPFSIVTIRHGVEATLDLTDLSQEIASIHTDTVKLGHLITEKWTDVPPVLVAIEKCGDDVNIAVNGERLSLTPLEKQSVIVLSLMDYKNALSVIEFASMLPPPKQGTVPEPKTRFDSGLKFLKRFKPFTWTANRGERHVKGLIIEKKLSDDGLRAYLGR